MFLEASWHYGEFSRHYGEISQEIGLSSRICIVFPGHCTLGREVAVTVHGTRGLWPERIVDSRETQWFSHGSLTKNVVTLPGLLAKHLTISTKYSRKMVSSARALIVKDGAYFTRIS